MADPQPQHIDWDHVFAATGSASSASLLGAAVFEVAGTSYASSVDQCLLLEFNQVGSMYLYDQAGAVDAAQADRTVVAWAVTPSNVAARDTGYQRGFPLAELDDGTTRDRGHLVPHLSGGLFGPNIFPQSRSLNRGWSDAGKRYRAIERRAAQTADCFFFGRLVYIDHSDYPGWVEIGTVIGGVVDWSRFQNRDDDGVSSTDSGQV